MLVAPAALKSVLPVLPVDWKRASSWRGPVGPFF